MDPVLGRLPLHYAGAPVLIPLYGALVRFRANYTPRGIALPVENEDQDSTSITTPPNPVAPASRSTGYFQMLFRVKRLEGYAGWYKGTIPMIVNAFVYLSLTVLWESREYFGWHGSPFPAEYIFVLVHTIVQLPFSVIVNRAITTPYKLPFWSVGASLTVLLSPYERSRPWTLFFTPGLLTAQVLHVMFRMFAFQFQYTIHHWGLAVPVQIAVFISFIVFPVLVLCPLEVMATRLSLQRNNPRSPEGAVMPEEDTSAAQTFPVYARDGDEEEVMNTCPETDPYTGFFNCAKRMISEEGMGILYRGWWITMYVESRIL